MCLRDWFMRWRRSAPWPAKETNRGVGRDFAAKGCNLSVTPMYIYIHTPHARRRYPVALCSVARHTLETFRSPTSEVRTLCHNQIMSEDKIVLKALEKLFEKWFWCPPLLTPVGLFYFSFEISSIKCVILNCRGCRSYHSSYRYLPIKLYWFINDFCSIFTYRKRQKESFMKLPRW